MVAKHRKQASAGARRPTKGALRPDKKGDPVTGGAVHSEVFQQFPVPPAKIVVLRCVLVTPAERAQMQRWVAARTSPQRLVVRSRIILLASDGLSIGAIAAHLHVSRTTVRLWCRRFHQKGVGALAYDSPGRGRRPGMSPSATLAVLKAMVGLQAGGDTWTVRSLAGAGTSASTVWRVWKRFRLGATSSPSDLAHALEQVISETSKRSK